MEAIKKYANISLKVVGIIAASALAFFALTEILWACYYAGLPM